MNFRFELEQLNASSLIEAFFTLLSSAGLPAYLGWHGDPATIFALYTVIAGFGLAAGVTILHPPADPHDPGVLLVSWMFQTLIVAIVGGAAFGIASLLH